MTETGILPEEVARIPEEPFSFDGYQVVRGEFFSHIQEPSVSFNNFKFYVNTACLNKMPQVDYVQVLVDPDAKRLVLRPCEEDVKDAFLWCLSSDGKRRPKQITARLFSAKIAMLMDWNLDHRYKLLGKLIRHRGEILYMFDLTATEVYQRIRKDGERPHMSRIPTFPAEWEHQFGLPVEEHKKQLQIKTFKGYTVFDLKAKKDELSMENPHEPDAQDLR